MAQLIQEPYSMAKYKTAQQEADAKVASYNNERTKAYGTMDSFYAETKSLFGKSKKVKKKSSGVGSSTVGKAKANKSLAKQLTKQSFLLEMQGLQSAKDALLSTAKTNALKQQYELSISLEEAATKFASVSSAQRAAAGASGLAMNSQSFLDVYAETANQYTIQTNRLKDVTRINQESLYKEALLRAEEYNIEINSVSVQQRLQDLMIDQNS